MKSVLKRAEVRITRTHIYLSTASGLMFLDILQGHIAYGIGVLALAITEEIGKDEHNDHSR